MGETRDSVFIGVDGGATKTLVVAINATGEELGRIRGAGSSLILTAQRSWEVLSDLIRQVLPADIPASRVHLGIGIAATELEEERRALLSLASVYASVVVESDAYTACLGAHAMGEGAVLIIGTGAVGLAIKSEGRQRVGGWGFPHDDWGGGAWLGMEAVNAALRAADGRLQPSAFTQAVLERCGGTPEHLSDWGCKATSSRFATLAREVVEHAEKGDGIAADILSRGASEVSLLGETLVEGTAPDYPVALVGGVAPAMKDLLSDALKPRLRPAIHDPALGAALMARRGLCDQSRVSQ